MNPADGVDERSPMIFWLVFVAGTGLGFAMKAWVLAKSPGKETPIKKS